MLGNQAYEIRSRFSEIEGKVIVSRIHLVASDGVVVHREPAFDNPLAEAPPSLENRLKRLAAEGVLVENSEAARRRPLPVAERKGALARFLASRDE